MPTPNDYADLLSNVKATADAAKKTKGEINGIADASGKANKEWAKLHKLLKSDASTFSRVKKDAKDLAASLKDNSKASMAMAGSFQKGGGQVKGMWKALKSGDFNAIRDAAKDAKEYSMSTRSGIGATNKLGGAMKTVGKIVKGTAAGIGGLSEVLAGPAGIAAAVGMTIIKGAISIDKYIKDMNKSFAMVRGPSIMNTDVKDQFNDFNKSIVSMSDNIRDGLNSRDVLSFAESVNAAGQRVSSISEGLRSYRDVVHIAAKASKVFGVEITAVGNFMTNMMLQQRLNVGDLDDAFKSMSFSADRSGLSTDKFWNSVINATASLAFYGKFVKAVSQTMTDFTQKQVAGIDETQQLVGDMTQAFKKAGVGTNMAIMGVAGMGIALKDDFTEAAKAAGLESEKAAKKVAELKEAQVKAEKEKPGSGDKYLAEIERAQYEVLKYSRQQNRLTQSAGGDQVAMAENLASLSDKAPQVLMKMLTQIMKSNGQNVANYQQGDKLYAALTGASKIMKGLVSEDEFNQMLEAGREDSDLLTKTLNSNTDIGKTLDEGFDDFANSSDTQVKEQRNTLDATLDNKDRVDETADILSKNLKIDLTSAKVLAKAATVDKKVAANIRKLVGLTDKGKQSSAQILAETKAQVAGSDDANLMATTQFKDSKKHDQTVAQKYQKTFEEVRDSTLSIQDMVDIATDSAKYNLVSLMHLNTISKWITGIATKYLGGQKGQEKLEPAINAMSDKTQKANETSVKIAKQIEEVSDQLAEAEARTVTNVGEVNKRNIDVKTLKATLDQLKLDKKKADDDATRYNATKGVLDNVASALDTQSKLAEAAIAGDDKQLDALLKGLDIDKDQGMLLDDVQKAVGGSKKIAEALWKKTGGAFRGEEAVIKRPTAVGGVVTSPQTRLVGEAGPEAIIPLNRAAPMLAANAPAGVPGGAGGKSIQIIVNANTKDLAQMIAGAVRGELYKAQVSG